MWSNILANVLINMNNRPRLPLYNDYILLARHHGRLRHHAEFVHTAKETRHRGRNLKIQVYRANAYQIQHCNSTKLSESKHTTALSIKDMALALLNNV